MTTPAESNLGLALIERLMQTTTRLGISYGDGGVEHFAANLESNLYALCRGVEHILEADTTAVQTQRQEDASDA